MFDIVVKWQDNSVNLCNLTDFWLMKPVLVTVKEENEEHPQSCSGKITKVIDPSTVEVTCKKRRTPGPPGVIKELRDLNWDNKTDFVGTKLRWAADSSWEGEILSLPEKARKFNPKNHMQEQLYQKDDMPLEDDESDCGSVKSSESRRF